MPQPSLPTFTAEGGRLMMDGAPFAVRGVSWFGFETPQGMVHGLWASPMADYVRFVAKHGFNALRVPLAVNLLQRNPRIDENMVKMDPAMLELARNGGRYLDAIDRLFALAAHAGLLVMPDMHRLEAAVWPDPDGIWYRKAPTASADDGGVAGLQWAAAERERNNNDELLAAWSTVLSRYCSSWNLFAADLFNEPWGARWGAGGHPVDWRAAAEAIGGAVLSACPRLLVFVEGVGNGPEEREFFWGEATQSLSRAAHGSRCAPCAVVLCMHH